MALNFLEYGTWVIQGYKISVIFYSSNVKMMTIDRSTDYDSNVAGAIWSNIPVRTFSLQNLAVIK